MVNKTVITQEFANTDIKDFLSSRDVCRMLNVSIDTLNRYCMDGKITFYKPNNGKRVFVRKDVLNYMVLYKFNSKEDIIEQANASSKEI